MNYLNFFKQHLIILRLTFFVMAQLVVMNMSATVRTVNNNGGGQFFDIGSAVTAASSGDTIYVCGSSSSYFGTNISKTNLVFIGAGFNPAKQNPVKTVMVNSWTIGNGNTVIGFELSNIAFATTSPTSIRFSRCRMAGFNSTNNTFVNCMFDNCLWAGFINPPFTNQFLNGLVISNCLFYAISGASIIQNTLLNGSVFIDHCIFIKDGSTIPLVSGSTSVNGYNFTNNIFMNVTLPLSAAYQYTNNYSASDLSLLGTGNITGTTWPFITPQASVTGAFQYAWNFHLPPGSPLSGIGSFGSDLGIFGGANPYKTDGEPPIPQIDIMMLNGTQFTSGGTLNLQFQSSVQD